MRIFCLIFLLIISLKAFGQVWHLNKVDKTQKYSYDYRFFPDYSDSNSYTINRKIGIKPSTIFITDYYGDTSLFALITVLNLNTRSIDTLPISPMGRKQLMLDSGQYQITISCFGYDLFHVTVEINSGEFIDLKVKLGAGPELVGWYHIRSIIELSEPEILKVIECVKERRTNPSKICEDKKKYYISIEI
jgi:hypothetical protein